MEDHGSTIVKGANARHAVWKREAAWPGKRAFVFVFVSVFVVVFVFVHRRTCMSVRVCTCTCVYTCVHVWVSKVGSRIWMATLRAFLSRLSIGPPPAHPLFSILFSCAVWVCHFFGFVQHSLEIRATATLSSKHCIIASRFVSMSFNTGEAKGMRQAQTSIHKGCGALGGGVSILVCE